MTRLAVPLTLLTVLLGAAACGGNSPETAPAVSAPADPVLDRIAAETDCASLEGVFTIAKAGRDRATGAADIEATTSRMVAATTRMATLHCPQ